MKVKWTGIAGCVTRRKAKVDPKNWAYHISEQDAKVGLPLVEKQFGKPAARTGWLNISHRIGLGALPIHWTQ